MTTATVQLQITCPDWCEVPADEHVRDLWTLEGNCIHHSPVIQISDREGLSTKWDESQVFGDRVEFNMITHTAPDGRETSPASVMLGSRLLSISQAAELAEALHSIVRAYRASGGVA